MHKYGIKYHAQPESITIEYNNQFICYHAYSIKNKRPFRHFSERLIMSQPQDINEVYRLARNPNISSQAGFRGCKIIF